MVITGAQELGAIVDGQRASYLAFAVIANATAPYGARCEPAVFGFAMIRAKLAKTDAAVVL